MIILFNKYLDLEKRSCAFHVWGYLFEKKEVKETIVVYKHDDLYILNRNKILSLIRDKVDEFILSQKENKNYTVHGTITDSGNVFELGSVTLPVENVILINEEYKDIDTDAQILLSLCVSISEGIVGD